MSDGEDIDSERSDFRVYSKIIVAILVVMMFVVHVTRTLDLFRISRGALKRVSRLVLSWLV